MGSFPTYAYNWMAWQEPPIRENAPAPQDDPLQKMAALQQYQAHLGQMPERKKPSMWQRIAAGAAGGLLGAAGQGQAASKVGELIQYPGYQNEVQDWKQKEALLGKAVDIERQQQEDELRRRLNEEQILTQKKTQDYYQARAAAQGRAPAPSLPRSVEEVQARQLHEALQSEDPAVRAAAQEQLSKLTSKPAPTQRPIAVGYGQGVFDPAQGKMVVEPKPPAQKPPTPPVTTPLQQSTLALRKAAEEAKKLAGAAAMGSSTFEEAKAKLEAGSPNPVHYAMAIKELMGLFRQKKEEMVGNDPLSQFLGGGAAPPVPAAPPAPGKAPGKDLSDPLDVRKYINFMRGQR